MRDGTEHEHDLVLAVAVVALAALTCLVAWQGTVIISQRDEIRALWEVVHRGSF